MKILRALILPALVLNTAVAASALSEKCTPAEDLIKALTSLADMPAELTDSLALQLRIRVTAEGGGPLNERVFYRLPDGSRADLPLDEDNIMSGAQGLAGADPATQFCRARNDGKDVADKSNLSVDLAFDYNEAGGAHTAETLLDGLSDGTAQMKTLAPAAVRLFVPKLKYIVAAPAQEGGPAPVVTAYKGGEALPDFPVSYYEGLPTFSGAALKKSGADNVQITGAPYVLKAMPKPKRGDLSDSPQSPAEAKADQ